MGHPLPLYLWGSGKGLSGWGAADADGPEALNRLVRKWTQPGAHFEDALVAVHCICHRNKQAGIKIRVSSVQPSNNRNPPAG